MEQGIVPKCRTKEALGMHRGGDGLGYGLDISLY
jgi:hypothetical protein